MGLKEIIDDERKKREDDSEKERYIPEGCRACGGPYPSCKTSCPMFDD